MLKWSLALALPVAVVMASIALARDIAYNDYTPDNVLAMYFWVHLTANYVLAAFAIWLLGRVGLWGWRRWVGRGTAAQ